MNVAIVGGGILGICLGYFLAEEGVKVEIFEASKSLGGLAGPLYLEDGTAIDRFYHAILSSDQHLMQLCRELSIDDQLRFQETKTGFYYRSAVYSMNNLVEFLRFPPLNWIDRFRLGLTVLRAQMIRDWHSLESVSVEKWLVTWSGRRTYTNIWRPLLKAKFDGDFSELPATYIWSRLVRMKSTRRGANQKEMAGHLIGGYMTLLNAMANRIREHDGHVHLGCPVQEIVIEQGAAQGLLVGQEMRRFDVTVATVQTPLFRRLIPGASQDYLDSLDRIAYLGIICPLMVLDRPLSGFWALNITDADAGIPFTGIIETTSYIRPEYVGGHHLVYLPKYVAPCSQWLGVSDEEIRRIWQSNLQQMFPDLNSSCVRYFLVHRERYVEPIHRLNAPDVVPGIKTPVQNLYLATTAQIYPELTNGESVSQHARRVAQAVVGGSTEGQI